MNQVPNGSVSSCATCHTSVPSLNSFGDDVLATLAGGVDWSALWDLDSDGDGQTNGAELGDPCGDWTVGATPGRTTDISNPGEASSTSADPNSPTCGGTGGAGGSTSSGVGGEGGSTSSGVGGEGGSASGIGGSSSGIGGSSSGTGGSSSGTVPPADTEDDSGCSLSSHKPSSSLAAFALLAIGLLLGRRRR